MINKKYNLQLIVLVLIGILLSLSDYSFAQEVNDVNAADKSYLTKDELAIWNDVAFRKQFAESYIAETDIEPRVTIEEREQMQEVLEFISSDKLDLAVEMLIKSINPASSAVFDFTIANIYFQQENFEQASKYYKTSVEKYPKFRRAWRNAALIYVRQNDFEKAVPVLTRVIELGGGDALTYGLLGFAHSSVGNNLSAESAYRMAILLDPVTIDWKMGLARSFFKQERFAEAVAICKQLIDKNPDRADFWLLQANAYIGLNQPLKAAEIYELVNQLGKSTADSLNMLGDIYINQELYDLAVGSYIQAMQKNPQASPQRQVRSAKVLSARGALKQTRELVENIEKIYGQNLDAEYKKDLLKIQARLAVADGSAKEEVAILEEIVALDPLDGEALILLGQNSQRNGDDQKAAFYYERAAGIEKFEADAKIRHAQLLVGKGKYNEALPLIRRAQMINPRENIQKYLEQVERISKTQ